MRGSRQSQQERIPTTRRGDDPPVVVKTAEEMTAVEHFLSDYAAVPAPPPTSRR
jgi:hypothetical protein